jgi:hypothetical protein
MKNGSYRGRPLKAMALGFVLVLGTLGLASAQENLPRVVVQVPGDEIEVKEGGEDFQIDILAEDVENLAAFQFSLSYDSSIINYVKVEEGPFLGSSEREPKCLDPRLEPGDPEVLRFNCVTMGPPVSEGGPAGAEGSGVLAMVTFSPVGGGETPLEQLEGRLVAADINETGVPIELETTVVSASLEVASSGGSSWLLWGPIIGVGALVLIGLAVAVVRTRRGPKSSPTDDTAGTDDTVGAVE